ncbi:MAG TPA: arsinothricin resistance N-acetyltransferase ArsN1 family B [Opitutaceae bacterium]|nr:arsinothricin resistance N-acetyltransferase ArsN1 family B [Opitutaceae bacterium]
MDAGIRPIEPADAEAVAAIYRPFVEGSPVSFETAAPGGDEMRRRIGELCAQYPWLVFEAGGKVRGYAYASAHRARAAYRWCVEVTVYAAPEARRRGVGRALYGALFAVLRAQGYANAYAGVTLPNPASVGLHESLGFTDAGVYRRVGHKAGAWQDVAWLQLRLQDPPEPPPEPRPAPAVLADPKWAAVFRAQARTARLRA